MTMPSVANHEPLDALFDTRPLAMAERFGDRALKQILDGRDPVTAARLAASYAFMHKPELRVEPAKGSLADMLMRLGTELNRDNAERLLGKHMQPWTTIVNGDEHLTPEGVRQMRLGLDTRMVH